MPHIDKQERKEYNKKYYKKLPKRIRTKKEREKNAKSTREWRQRNPIKSMWASAKNRAKKKKLEFNIELSDIIIPEKCPILNIPLFRSELKQSGNSPALDRIDNTKGYIKNNIRVISHKANLFKGDMSIFEVEKLLQYMKG